MLSVASEVSLFVVLSFSVACGEPHKPVQPPTTIDAGVIADAPSDAASDVLSDASDASDAMTPSTIAVDVSPAAPTTEKGITLAMRGSVIHANLRFDGVYAAMYGGRISNAVQIIAMNGRTGAVQPGTDARAHASPLRVNDVDVAPANGPSGIETDLTFDLRDQVPARGAYRVFLWLDGNVTPVQTVSVQPVDPASSADPFHDCADIVHIVAGDAPGSDVTLTGTAPSDRIAPHAFPNGVTLAGAIGAARVKQALGEKAAILTLSHQDRDVHWCALTLPKDAAKTGVRFELPLELLSGHTRVQKMFVLVAFGGATSSVVRVTGTPSR